MTIGLALEIASNLMQQVIVIGFLYMFFDKPEGRVRRVVPFCAAVLLLTATATYFTLGKMFFHYLYYMIALAVMMLYTVVFLRGKLYLRFIVPVAVSNISIAYLTVNIMSAFGKIPFAAALTASEPFRCLVLFTANAIYGVFLYIVYRFGKGKINMRSLSDVLAFIVIPAMTCTVGLTALLAFETADFNEEIQPHIIIICLSTAVTAIIFWVLLVKAGRDARVRTDLMLSRQREELYRRSVLGTNEQLERISAMKHDEKNLLMSVGMLISEGEYDKAKALCDRTGEQLTATYTPVHTKNPMLNAILNVELEKALAREIDFTYELGSTLEFVEDSDVVSVIGNLCDNAMEYLAARPVAERKMELSVTAHQTYYCVICRNAVSGSVLSENPALLTTKDDKTIHGKGIGILRGIAEKYGGELLFAEENNILTVSVVLRGRSETTAV